MFRFWFFPSRGLRGVLRVGLVPGARLRVLWSVSVATVRPWVQLDLFGGPEVVYVPRMGKKKAPACDANAPGAVIGRKGGLTDA